MPGSPPAFLVGRKLLLSTFIWCIYSKIQIATAHCFFSVKNKFPTKMQARTRNPSCWLCVNLSSSTTGGGFNFSGLSSAHWQRRPALNSSVSLGSPLGFIGTWKVLLDAGGPHISQHSTWGNGFSHIYSEKHKIVVLSLMGQKASTSHLGFQWLTPQLAQPPGYMKFEVDFGTFHSFSVQFLGKIFLGSNLKQVDGSHTNSILQIDLQGLARWA